MDFMEDIGDQLREMTGGRGPDAVLDAVGMEAHNSPVGAFAQHAVGLLPDALAKKAMETAGVDRMTVLHAAVDSGAHSDSDRTKRKGSDRGRVIR